MKTTSNHLPPELQAFASLLDAHPPEVQEAFQFLLATAMHEGGNPRLGKFELMSVTEVDGQWALCVQGCRRGVQRGKARDDQGERRVREEVRDVLGEEKFSE